MSKRALLAVAGLVGFCLPLFGQTPFTLERLRSTLAATRADSFALDNPALFRPWPTSTLFGGESSSFATSLGWTTPLDSQPPSSTVQRLTGVPPPSSNRNLTDQMSDWLPNFNYVSGEVGFLYGRSTGKFGGDYKEAYIIGDVGDDRFHISVGAAYQDSNLHFSRH